MKPVLVLLLALALLAVGYLALRGLEGDEEPLSVAGLPATSPSRRVGNCVRLVLLLVARPSIV